jgi:hypothetical protein
VYGKGGGHHQGLREMQDRRVVMAGMELLLRPGHRGLHSTLITAEINAPPPTAGRSRPASAEQCGAVCRAGANSTAAAAERPQADRRHYSMLVRSLRHRSARWSPIHLETSERLSCEREHC